MLSSSKKRYAFGILLLLFVASCRKQNETAQQGSLPSLTAKQAYGAVRFDAYVIQAWYDLMLKLIKETPGHTPPVAARSFGYAGIALYESLAGEMAHHSLAGQLQGLNSLPKRQFGNSYSAPIIANAALARIINFLFPNASVSNHNKINSLEKSIEDLYSQGVGDVIVQRSKTFGYGISDAVFNWSKTDGGDGAYSQNFPGDYIPPPGIDKWVPTPPSYQNAMLPYWGRNRTLLTSDNPGAIDPPSPTEFSVSAGSSFFNAAYEVYNTVNHLTQEQRTIALYWADGANTFTPPGHNIAIALQMIRNQRMNLYQAAMLLAKLGIAENDAAIVCWRAKFTINLLRPVSYIHSYIDANWSPLISTPPFPSYMSGHSSFSGAAAAILSAEIGDNVSFTDSSKLNEGFEPRFFPDFYEAAAEAAVSRLYGGIHYGFDNRNGLKCGQDIGANVEKLNW